MIRRIINYKSFFIVLFLLLLVITGCKKNDDNSNNNSSNSKNIYKVIFDSNGGSFDSNGGSSIDSQEIVEGNKIVKPNDPTKSNNVFDGWYIGNDKIDFNTYLVNSNIILTAKWNAIFRTSQSGNKISITGLNYNDIKELVIPETIDGYRVTSIGEYAFYNRSSLTSIIIPNSVTSIGSDAFYNCPIEEATIPSIACKFIKNNKLKTVVITSGETIENYSFYNCTSLTRMTIPDSVTSIGEYSFYNCTSLTSIAIPDSVTSIGSSAFSGCTSLTNITIPDSVTNIGHHAFAVCTSLTSITIPASVTSIGEKAFIGCSALTSIIVDENNTVYDSRNNCNAIIKTETNTLIFGCQNTLIPNTVTSIGDYAFYNCTSLTSIIIPNRVIAIGSFAFSGCKSLINIIIPDSVIIIGSDAFSGCTSLTNITIPYSVTNIEFHVFLGCTSLTNITIPDSVTWIESSAFSGCTSLTNITIPDSVTSIGDYAFSGCTSLTNITIPDSLTRIGSSAFNSCPIEEATIPSIACKFIKNNRLKTVIITSGDSIENEAFLSCASLKSITIPDSVTRIGLGAFNSCPIEEATIPSIACKFIKNNKLKTVVITSGESIENEVFSGCTSLTSITIPDSVTRIGSSAFNSCPIEEATIPSIACKFIKNNRLKTVVITSGEYIGSDAFSGCTSLTNITIPESVTSIENFAFSGCTSLTSIIIPDSVTSIRKYAFRDCSNLTIYCEAPSKPDGWDTNWNYDKRPVVWGYKAD